MTRMLLKTLCLSIFFPLYLKAQNSTLKATVISNESEQSAHLAISLEEGNLSLETIREITFDVSLVDAHDKVYFANVRDETYTKHDNCEKCTISVEVNSQTNLSYRITTPTGLYSNRRISNTININEIRAEAMVMLVAGIAIKPEHIPHRITIEMPQISYEDCSDEGECTRKTTNDVLTEGFSKVTRPSGTGKITTGAYSQTTIYPNPATNFFTLTTLPTSGMVNIFNTSGQLIYQSSTTASLQNIVTDSWQNGLYFVQIIDFQTQTVEQHKLNIIK